MREFKVGDWVVSLQDVGRRRNKGDVFRIIKFTSNGKNIYYKPNTHGSMNTFRLATPSEIPEEHRPKLVTKEEKNKLLDLIKSI